jgi:hypothetical protein
MVTRSTRWVLAVLLACSGVLAVAAAASAADIEEPLFDRFSFTAEGSFVGLTTEIRLDSELLGRGTTLSFEDDLDLDSSKVIPSLDFEWQIARRHKLGVRWQSIDRASSAQTLTEIQWGEEVIPVDANISLGFDIDQYFVDYAYYPWVKERWAAGFGLGIRVMDIGASLAWEERNVGAYRREDATGTGPLPYLYFEYRRMLSERWRFEAGLGWLQVTIDDIDGGQWVGSADVQYLLGRHWGLGAAVNLSAVDVDWEGVETEDSVSLLTAAVDLDINDFSVFARFRF